VGNHPGLPGPRSQDPAKPKSDTIPPADTRTPSLSTDLSKGSMMIVDRRINPADEALARGECLPIPRVPSTQNGGGMSTKRTFFISRTGVDRHWAELIASVVKDAGHEAIHQDEHFGIGESFSHNMMLAAESDCTIAVLSPAYFRSEHCLAELHAALASDPIGMHGRIMPVLVAPCELPRLLGHLAYLDLVGAGDDTARKRFLDALLKHGKLDRSKLLLHGRTRRVVEQANRNRSAMLEKVRNIWITGFLQKSLTYETRILLGLSERPEAVARPLDLLVQRPDQGERPLPPGTQVVKVFDEMGQALLILGAPGSGKTTLLLELTSDLLERATHDPEHPIPVVFPLSTWAQSRKPLADWLVDELNLRYDINVKISQEWVEADQVLPLLDGLDEVTAEHRAACVEAINTFRHAHGLLPVVISSRTTDYKTLPALLRLQGAIVVQPLTHHQVDSYLTDIGLTGEIVSRAIRDDPTLSELLDTPLMLSIVTVAYADPSGSQPQMSGTIEERRDRLFGAYVKTMFRRRSTERRYTPEQTVNWLGWLGRQMIEHEQTVFYVERVQYNWLPPRHRAWPLRVCYCLVAGLTLGFVGGVFEWAVLSVAGLLEILRRYWELGRTDGLTASVIVGTLSVVSVYGILTGCGVGCLGVVVGLLDATLNKTIKLAETIEFSLLNVIKYSFIKFTRFIFYAMLVGFISAFSLASAALEVVRGPAYGLLLGLLWGVGFGLVCGLLGLIIGLLILLSKGFSVNEIETRAIPNQGIHLSARNALVSGLLSALSVTLLFATAFSLITYIFNKSPIELLNGLVGGLLFGSFVGLASALAVGLKAGGLACLKHLAFRLLLVRNGFSPWNYVKFLDYAAGRILLRKVGGGYAFIHRMLLEYFATRYVEPSTEMKPFAKPFSMEMEV